MGKLVIWSTSGFWQEMNFFVGNIFRVVRLSEFGTPESQ